MCTIIVCMVSIPDPDQVQQQQHHHLVTSPASCSSLVNRKIEAKVSWTRCLVVMVTAVILSVESTMGRFIRGVHVAEGVALTLDRTTTLEHH